MSQEREHEPTVSQAVFRLSVQLTKENPCAHCHAIVLGGMLGALALAASESHGFSIEEIVGIAARAAIDTWEQGGGDDGDDDDGEPVQPVEGTQRLSAKPPGGLNG